MSTSENIRKPLVVKDLYRMKGRIYFCPQDKKVVFFDEKDVRYVLEENNLFVRKSYGYLCIKSNRVIAKMQGSDRSIRAIVLSGVFISYPDFIIHTGIIEVDNDEWGALRGHAIRRAK